MTRCALYRHFDAAGTLLYVGVSKNLRARDKQHTDSSEWMKFVARTETAWFDSVDAALAAERAAIVSENPIHNIVRTLASVPVQPSAGWRAAFYANIKARGLRMRAVSLAAGCSASYLHAVLVEGKDPTIDKFLAICAAAEIDPCDMLRLAPTAERSAA